jgi:hypothetical protein
MKKFILSLCLLILAPGVYGNSDTEREKPIEISRDRFHRVVMVKHNKARFTKNWAFVVDSSHSTWSVAGKVLKGFTTATGFPTDELRFCAYVFNDQGWAPKHYRDWVDASPEEFDKTQNWIRNTRGVGSIATPALVRALQQPVKELTILIISDGGFTDGGGKGGEGIGVVQAVIEAGQKWRELNGYGRALIVSIGIENTLCWPYYPKLPNSDCQLGMRNIGVDGKGGFFYIHKIREQSRKTSQILTKSK